VEWRQEEQAQNEDWRGNAVEGRGMEKVAFLQWQWAVRV
jgi:hypothetical protein